MNAVAKIQIKEWIQEACHKNGIGSLGVEIRVAFDKSMTRCFGAAFATSKLIKLSTPLWAKATDEQKKQVVIHETCHIIVYSKHGSNIRPHGQEWKHAMFTAGQVPERTHKVSRTPRQYVKYELRCPCTPSVWVGHKHATYARFNKLSCKSCKHKVTLTGNTKRPGGIVR